jgi:acyl-CoA thioesterase
MPQRPENGGIDKKLFEYIVKINKQTPFHRFLDMNVTYLGQGIAKLKMRVKQEYTNPAGVAHGGIAFSVVDTAMGMATRTLGREVTTIEMNINYLYPVTAGDVIMAIGRVVKAGRQIIVCEGEVYNRHGKLLAKARETFLGWAS